MELSRRQALGIGAGLASGLLVGCIPAGGVESTAGRGPAGEGTPTTPPLPEVRHPQSLPALMHRTFDSDAPLVRRRIVTNERWTKDEVMYGSGGLDISGVLYVPRGDGPFPAVVLAHGYTPPARYVTGTGMEREQVYLADQGWVVLHTDYRGHAASTRVPALEMELGLGFAEDTLNAISAVSRLPQVDPRRVGLFGLSMGGGVTYNALVTAPDMVQAAVVWAPVSSRFQDNYHQLLARKLPHRVNDLRRNFGPPTADNPFYADLSARTFFDRITAPVLIDHGTADATCPFVWSRESTRLLRRAGVDVRLRRRWREQHIYDRQWRRAMEQTHAFLEDRLPRP